MGAIRVCKKCCEPKTTDDFYESNLGTCKECIKAKAKLQRELLISTPEGLEKERVRHRDKYHRLGYKEQQKEWNKNKPWKESTVYKGLRGKYYKDLPREFELHHWNYNDYYLLDVFILNIRDHKNLHNSLILDLEKKNILFRKWNILRHKRKTQKIY